MQLLTQEEQLNKNFEGRKEFDIGRAERMGKSDEKTVMKLGRGWFKCLAGRGVRGLVKGCWSAISATERGLI
jgi:hypothetical protein